MQWKKKPGLIAIGFILLAISLCFTSFLLYHGFVYVFTGRHLEDNGRIAIAFAFGFIPGACGLGCLAVSQE